MISYNLYDNYNKLNELRNNFESLIINSLRKDYDYDTIYDYTEYEYNNLGFDSFECLDYNNNYYLNDINEKIEKIKNVINKINSELERFCDSFKYSDYKLPKNPNEENIYRILSFPWCISGKVLSTIKKLSNCKI